MADCDRNSVIFVLQKGTRSHTDCCRKVSPSAASQTTRQTPLATFGRQHGADLHVALSLTFSPHAQAET
eukprot:8499245-Alexandrium_andersonii.AAC.1